MAEIEKKFKINNDISLRLVTTWLLKMRRVCNDVEIEKYIKGEKEGSKR